MLLIIYKIRLRICSIREVNSQSSFICLSWIKVLRGFRKEDGTFQLFRCILEGEELRIGTNSIWSRPILLQEYSFLHSKNPPVPLVWSFTVKTSFHFSHLKILKYETEDLNNLFLSPFLKIIRFKSNEEKNYLY